ncbi:MAG: ABC transporter related protein [Candidatus Wolfebacteria bacterium GW2011_GWC2_39_22]|uniref:ABC transporter related protein n=1 Tax=Candidatus Wolfebacteria bacterium GW2011_GWC2_39_22 TaxID=1619013 RepID=A0A0G0RGQ8_9BACT|nr:MAG: ABC transporter related protein [Candidatus Wolfebacteria bacterium GW2011_GWC2_39_22]HBI25496.1 hypothetical protein [Candidatus Wolfebacteria bacterium]
MKQFLFKTLEIYRPFQKTMGVMFLFMIVMQIFNLVSPYLYGRIIDGVVSQQPIQQVLFIAFMAFMVYATQELLGYLSDQYELKYFDFAVPRHIKVRTLNKFFTFSIGQHNNQNSGVKRSVITRGEHSLNSLAFKFAYEIIPMVLQVLFTVVALLYINWILGSIVLSGVVIFVAITIYLNIILREEMTAVRDLWVENDKEQSELIQNVELVQVNVQEKRVVNEYSQSYETIGDRSKILWGQYTFFSSLRGLLVVIVRFAVIAIGIWFVYEGKYTPGYLVIFLTWSSNAFSRLSNFGNTHRQVLELYSSVQKYYEMIDVPCDIVMTKHPISPAIEGKIEFKNVSFRYPARNGTDKGEDTKKDVALEEPALLRDALTGVNLIVEPGQRVAFVGHSGAGKSTLAQMIIRAFDPVEGQILIDGHDLRELDLGYYRSHIGMVEQDVQLFDNTLRYNIAFGRPEEVSDAEFDEVSRLASIEQFRHRLEKGFDTLIGEKGVKLSGGERQRVGIARALIKHPKILIFDEATSSLDTENEQLIRQSIEQASQGRTTIIIAHRLSTIRDADKIFVMGDGNVVGAGTHEELMHSCKPYQNLIGKQMVSIV